MSNKSLHIIQHVFTNVNSELITISLSDWNRSNHVPKKTLCQCVIFVNDLCAPARYACHQVVNAILTFIHPH